MVINVEPTHIGIGPKWPTRKSLIKVLQVSSPASVDKIRNYISRTDLKNFRNVVESSTFSLIANQQEAVAMSLALEGKVWPPTLAYSTAYRLFADKLDYFWHYNFRLIFPEHPSPLRMFSHERAIVGLGYACVLGWQAEAIYQGYLIHSALKKNYQLVLPYETEPWRGHLFMIRLFAEWRGDVSHQWPSHAYDEPIYESLLEKWRTPDPEALIPWLLAACDRHTHQAAPETRNTFCDFSDPPLARTPIEILMLLRLREFIGLENPVIEHPLMEMPFDRLPEPQASYGLDEIMRGTYERARTDWPSLDDVLSLDWLMR